MSNIQITETVTKTTNYSINDCPFCGSSSLTLIKDQGEYGYRSACTYIKCENCNASGSHISGDSLSESMMISAINKWNNSSSDNSNIEVLIKELENLEFDGEPITTRDGSSTGFKFYDRSTIMKAINTVKEVLL